MTKVQFYSLVIRACKNKNYRGCYKRILKIIGKYYMVPRGYTTTTDAVEILLPVYQACIPEKESTVKLLRGIQQSFNSQYGPDGLDTTQINDTTIVAIINLISQSLLADYPDFLPPLWYRLNYGKGSK